MTPEIETALEAMRDHPGSISSHVCSTAAATALNEIERLRHAMKQMREDFRRIKMLAEQHCPADASVKHAD